MKLSLSHLIFVIVEYSILNKLALGCLLCFLLACNNVIIEEPDDELFTPQANMTHSQIVDLLEQAVNNTISSEQISYTIRDTTVTNNEYGYNTTGESIFEVFVSFNKQSQKSLALVNDHSYGTQFYFLDGCDNYYYRQLENILLRSKVADVYWSHLQIDIDDFDFSYDNYTWIIEGKRLIGQHKGAIPDMVGFSNFTETLEISLTKDMKINSYYYTIQLSNQISTTYHRRKCSCTYNAAPKMPQNHKISDFSPILQYEVKIIWENGKENLFYVADNGSVQWPYTFFPWEVSQYYDNSKELQLFYDANYSQAIEIPVIVTGNVTLYAKWVDDDKM